MITLRIKYKKENNMKFLSHLELIKTMERVFRRMGLPMAFSQGFSPKPKISYAAPLPVGGESECEFLDVELVEKVDIKDLLKNQKDFLPNGLEFLDAKYFGKVKSLMSQVSDSAYIIQVLTKEDHDKATIETMLETFMAQEVIEYEKYNKKKKLKLVNIKPLVQNTQVLTVNDNQIILKVLLTTGSNGNLKPEKFTEQFAKHSGLELLEGKERYRRVELYKRDQHNQLVTLFEV